MGLDPQSEDELERRGVGEGVEEGLAPDGLVGRQLGEEEENGLEETEASVGAPQPIDEWGEQLGKRTRIGDHRGGVREERTEERRHLRGRALRG